ncbi:restriction endonuclease subunit S [Methanosphaera cuniculi]|uniref:restriction endonuclease subunit S n=1 Tax=Methanosphaera cuniculi TaxID=1077256 RepID=UPI0026DBCA18|nr:restriction endonuclease subunit S [Methanosphaera cuniculi]
MNNNTTTTPISFEEDKEKQELKIPEKIPKLRFTEYSGEWNEIKLEDLIIKGKAGGTPKSSNKLYYDGNIPFLSINDMTKQGKYIKKTEKLITKEGLENSSAWIVPKNSLLYSMYASVGLVGINKKELTTSQAIYSMILNDEKTTLEYMYYYLVYFKKNIHKYIETGTQGNINAKTLKKFKIKIPSKEEQEKIGDFLSEIDKKISLMIRNPLFSVVLQVMEF